jgi:hypothetical protein
MLRINTNVEPLISLTIIPCRQGRRLYLCRPFGFAKRVRHRRVIETQKFLSHPT